MVEVVTRMCDLVTDGRAAKVSLSLFARSEVIGDRVKEEVGG